MTFPPPLRVRVETPKFSLLKREADGRVEYVSPLPCPWNYGSVIGEAAPDGDEADAVILGPRRPFGWSGERAVWGCVRFTDAGLPDDKWICSDAPPTPAQKRALSAFFAAYAVARRGLNRLQGKAPTASFHGIDWR